MVYQEPNIEPIYIIGSASSGDMNKPAEKGWLQRLEEGLRLSLPADPRDAKEGHPKRSLASILFLTKLREAAHNNFDPRHISKAGHPDASG